MGATIRALTRTEESAMYGQSLDAGSSGPTKGAAQLTMWEDFALFFQLQAVLDSWKMRRPNHHCGENCEMSALLDPGKALSMEVI